jgi:archaellum component FlaC
VCSDGEERADEEVIDEDGYFFNKAEHVLNRVKILIIVGKDFTYTFNDVNQSSGDEFNYT